MMDGSDRFLGIHLIIFKAEHVTIRSTNIVFNYEIKTEGTIVLIVLRQTEVVTYVVCVC